MRAPIVYLVCACMYLACAVRAAPAADTDATEPEALALAPVAPDTLAYLLPRLTTHYRPSGQWNGVTEQEMFLDASGLADQEPEGRYKRAGNAPSLSIINPLDVLRQRLLLEMARRQMRETQKQAVENRKLMNSIGKRGSFLRQPHEIRRPSLGFDTM